MPTISAGPTIRFQAAAGVVSPNRTVTASSSIFWMTAALNFRASPTAAASRMRTTRDAWATERREATPGRGAVAPPT